MGFWQWVMIIWWVIGFIAGMELHGRPRVDEDGNPQRYNIETVIVSILLHFIILYFGGFFK